MKKDVKNKKVTILGAARSGIAAAKLLKMMGAKVFVSDYMKKGIIAELDKEEIAYESGIHSQRVLEADFIVLSPGISQKTEIVKRIKEKNIPLYSEIEIASWFCKSPIIGVTGSNGKTTTTTLIGEMLRKKYADTIIAGNIGQPFSSFVADSQTNSMAVVELSSFQLETIDSFKAQTAVILNFAPNHLDWYETYEDYKIAKWRITKNFSPNDLLIYNGDDEDLSSWVKLINCRKLSFSVKREKDADACYQDGKLWLKGSLLINTNELQIRGVHNYMNVLAASLAAVNAGIDLGQIREVLQNFQGVEHRLEYVKEIDGVKYYNDSKATTVESLWYALQSFSTPIVLIAGGKDKGSEFTKLNELIAEKVKSVVLIGTASEKMNKVWQGIKPIEIADSLESAVKSAQKTADKEDIVLLSPACASFDMFSDFEDRGRQFKEIVSKLAGKNEIR